MNFNLSSDIETYNDLIDDIIYINHKSNYLETFYKINLYLNHFKSIRYIDIYDIHTYNINELFDYIVYYYLIYIKWFYKLSNKQNLDINKLYIKFTSCCRCYINISKIIEIESKYVIYTENGENIKDYLKFKQYNLEDIKNDCDNNLLVIDKEKYNDFLLVIEYCLLIKIIKCCIKIINEFKLIYKLYIDKLEEIFEHSDLIIFELNEFKNKMTFYNEFMTEPDIHYTNIINYNIKDKNTFMHNYDFIEIYKSLKYIYTKIINKGLEYIYTKTPNKSLYIDNVENFINSSVNYTEAYYPIEVSPWFIFDYFNENINCPETEEEKEIIINKEFNYYIKLIKLNSNKKIYNKAYKDDFEFNYKIKLYYKFENINLNMLFVNDNLKDN